MATFVPLTLAAPGSGTILVQPETVDELQDVPANLITTPPGPPCSYLSLLDGSRYVITGTAAANAALLAAGTPSTIASGQYTPTFSGFFGQVTAVTASVDWYWHRIGNYVHVHGIAIVSLAPGPGAGAFLVNPPSAISPGTGVNAVATMVPLPPTPAPEAPVSPYNTATDVGFDIVVTGIYPTVRVLASFMYQTP